MKIPCGLKKILSTGFIVVFEMYFVQIEECSNSILETTAWYHE